MPFDPAVLTDFERYCQTCLRIRNVETGELTPFVWWDLQYVVWEAAQAQIADGQPVRIVVLKPRQAGLSTWSEAFTFWQTATRKDQTSMVIAHDLAGATALFNMSKLMFDMMPPEYKPMGRYMTKREIVFDNDDERERPFKPGLRSSLEVQTSNNLSAGTGRTIHHLHGSEVSRWRDSLELLSTIFPAIPDVPGTSVILESTAKEAGTWFHRFWQDAVAGRNGYRAVFLPWYTVRRYYVPTRLIEQPFTPTEDERTLEAQVHLSMEQLEWRRRKIAQFESGEGELDDIGLSTTGLGEAIFKQEYPTTADEAFLVSGLPIFNDKLLKLVYQPQRPTRYAVTARSVAPDPTGDLLVWTLPVAGHQYAIGVDVSMGQQGGDFSCAQVVDLAGMEQVAEWHGLIDPILFAPLLDHIGMFYNEAMIALETNGVGLSTQRALLEQYANIYRWRTIDSIRESQSPKLGWETNIKTKPLMIRFADYWIKTGRCVIHGHELLGELKTFVRKGYENAGAATGCWDDRVMAWMIAVVAGHIDSGALEFYTKTADGRAVVPAGGMRNDQYDPVTMGMPLDGSGRRKLGDVTRQTDWRLL